jgi:hypothetical protein
MAKADELRERIKTFDYRPDEIEQREMRARRDDITFDSELVALRRMVDTEFDHVAAWPGINKNKTVEVALLVAYDNLKQERVMLDMEIEALRSMLETISDGG